MTTKETAAVGMHMGVAMDEVTSAVRAALMQDIITLRGACNEGETLMIHLPRSACGKLKGILDALRDSSTECIKTCAYSDPATEEVDCWCRYIVKDEVPLNHEHVYDRDFRVETGGGSINTQVVYPLTPPSSAVRPGSPQADPMMKPMPNPYSRPWFQYAKKQD